MIKTENGYAHIYKIYGRSETEVKECLNAIFKKDAAPNVTTKCCGKEVHVLAEIALQDADEAKETLKPLHKEIKKALGSMVYSIKEDETLEEAVVRLLVKYELTVTTAESCTGGMIASKLVNVAGVSDVFNEGFITYSNKAKRKILGVNKNTLKKYGAVSEQTVREMAVGGVFAADADACVAVSGIAGPDGGTDEKPVGLVYIGCCVKDDVVVKECHFDGTRMEVREQSANAALDLLRTAILNHYR